jgi:hypothetical protein
MSLVGVSNAVSVGSTVNFVSDKDFYIYSGLIAATTTGATYVDINLPYVPSKIEIYMSAGAATLDNLFWEITMDGTVIAKVASRYGNGSFGETPINKLSMLASGDTKLLIRGITSSGDFDNCNVVVKGELL